MPSRSKIRRCGRGPRQQSRSSRCRTTRKTEFKTSRAALKETTVSLGCCMDTGWKTSPLGLKAMTMHVTKAWKLDIANRIHGRERLNTEGCRVNVSEIKPGVVYKDRNVTRQSS